MSSTTSSQCLHLERVFHNILALVWFIISWSICLPQHPRTRVVHHHMEHMSSTTSSHSCGSSSCLPQHPHTRVVHHHVEHVFHNILTLMWFIITWSMSSSSSNSCGSSSRGACLPHPQTRVFHHHVEHNYVFHNILALVCFIITCTLDEKFCPIAGYLVSPIDFRYFQEMWLRFSSILQIFTYMKCSFSSSGIVARVS